MNTPFFNFRMFRLAESSECWNIKQLEEPNLRNVGSNSTIGRSKQSEDQNNRKIKIIGRFAS
jgi:hypothetical protein